MILEQLRQRAQARGATLAFPDSTDPRTIDAVQQLHDEKICRCILVNDQIEVDNDALCDYLLERRHGKGLTKSDAEKLSYDPLFIGAWLVHTGVADAGVAGSLSTTADVLRAGLWTIGMADNTSTVSSFFLMVWPDSGRVMTYADCGVVPLPTAEQLAEIAFAASVNHNKLTQHEPRVAFLSFSTKGSASHDSIDKVKKAFALFHQQHPEVIADGELQLDAAIVPLVAHSKAPDSPVSGMANVLIFPDLNAGNIAYKLTERLAGATALGPIVQGLRKPFVDLSRGCTSSDIVNVATIASLL